MKDKSLSQNISITLLQISLKLHGHRGSYWRKKLPWRIFEEQFPVPRYAAASKIGNSVISLLWQLRRRCDTDHNKLSSLSNTTVVAIFPKLCFWRRSLCSNLRGIDPEKLYRATLIQDLMVPVVTSLGWRYSRGKRAQLLIRSLPSRARVRTEMKRTRDLVDEEIDTENKKAD